ncbi:hypothetical protein EV199_2858 [Pseudobacter ginsenosidimutans]|uniref:Uncharacterized protein n=1 Tax=Pseudobacter ginsenosidimutans TaxID=661488 RepID=A0A4Q7MSU4_9BACT|nr:hypothetical protein EV199_2858 [Pseudobacter ginsenosidimutans]
MKLKMPLHYPYVVFDFPEAGTSPNKVTFIRTDRRIGNSRITALYAGYSSFREKVLSGSEVPQRITRQPHMRISMIPGFQTRKPDNGNINLKL